MRYVTRIILTFFAAIALFIFALFLVALVAGKVKAQSGYLSDGYDALYLLRRHNQRYSRPTQPLNPTPVVQSYPTEIRYDQILRFPQSNRSVSYENYQPRNFSGSRLIQSGQVIRSQGVLRFNFGR